MGWIKDLRAGRALRAASALGEVAVTGRAMPPASPWQNNDVLARILAEELFGTEYVHVDRALAMSLPVLARCRQVLFTTVGRLQIVAMRGAEPLPEQPWVTRQPEVNRSRFLTLGWTADALFWYGRAWWVAVERDAASDGGRARRFQWIPEYHGRFDADGNLIGLVGESRDLDPRDIYRIDGPHEGLLNFAAPTIRTAYALERAAARASDNPVPSIDLHQTGGDPMSNEQIDALITRWAKARRGANGGVSFTNQSIEAKTMGQAPEQLLIDGRKATDLALVRAAGAPAWVADVAVEGSNLTYSNTPARSRELIDYFAMGYLEAIAGRLSLDDILPAGQWATFDTFELLRGDFKDRMEAYKVAKEVGLYTDDELRVMERGAALEE